MPLLVQLLFHPSQWSYFIATIDPTLPPHFCLAELNGNAWRQPATWRMVATGYLLTPLLMAIIVGGITWATGGSLDKAMAGVGFGALNGWLFGLMVSAGTGVGVNFFATLLFGLVWQQPDLLPIDTIKEVLPGALLSLTYAVATWINANLALQQPDASTIARRLGSLVVGVLVTVVVLSLLAFGIDRLTVLFESGNIHILYSGLFVMLLFTLLLTVAIAWRTQHWRRTLRWGIMLYPCLVLLYGAPNPELEAHPSGLALLSYATLTSSLTGVLLIAVPYAVATRLAGALAGVFAGAIGSLAFHPARATLNQFYPLSTQLSIGAGLALLAVTAPYWRPLLCYPLELAWNALLLRIEERRPAASRLLFGWHSVFWDEQQRLPLVGLDEHLVLVMEQDSQTGAQAMLLITASRQRWAAQAAQIELDARRLARCRDLAAVAQSHLDLAAGELIGPVSALLRSFAKHSKDVAAALALVNPYHQRLALAAVDGDITGLLRELTRSSEPYARRFEPIALHWQRLVTSQVQTLAQQAETRQEIPDPYIVGLPLTRNQEIFVGRADVSAQIEELLRDQDRPPLLLYGQRRMGKTSLLYNLRWLLPHRIVPLLVDLQGPVSWSSDHTGLLYNIARMMNASAQAQNIMIPALTRSAVHVDPFTVFDEWLDELERTLLAAGRSTILLTLDEFETLEVALAEGRFHEAAVLGMLRHLVQHRPRFKVLLAGSHTLSEFRRWASYLINMQIVHLGYLQEDEVRQLVEQPIRHFPLRYTPEASQQVYQLTYGHPYLVQLLCSEIVSLKNQQPIAERRLATVTDVEASVPAALSRGTQFFSDIEVNQVDANGLRLLRWLAGYNDGKGVTYSQLATCPTVEQDAYTIVEQLLRRELVEEVEGGYRFQVELIRRWFRQR